MALIEHWPVFLTYGVGVVPMLILGTIVVFWPIK